MLTNLTLFNKLQNDFNMLEFNRITVSMVDLGCAFMNDNCRLTNDVCFNILNLYSIMIQLYSIRKVIQVSFTFV